MWAPKFIVGVACSVIAAAISIIFYYTARGLELLENACLTVSMRSIKTAHKTLKWAKIDTPWERRRRIDIDV